MRFRRPLVLALVAAVIAGPAAAIAVAGSGPSAGDNQYTDPLGTSTSTTHTAAPPPPATTPTAAAPAATATTPTATIASATVSTTSGSSSKTLPMTGYEEWAGALLGAGLVGAGFAVRRRLGAR